MNVEILEVAFLPCHSSAWSYNCKLLLDVKFSYEYNNYIVDLLLNYKIYKY